MRVDGNHGSTLGYEPNSYNEWQQQPDFAEPPLTLEGAADHWDFRDDDKDYYTQPGAALPTDRAGEAGTSLRQHGSDLGRRPLEVTHRHIENCLQADPAYGEGAAAALDMRMSALAL